MNFLLFVVCGILQVETILPQAQLASITNVRVGTRDTPARGHGSSTHWWCRWFTADECKGCWQSVNAVGERGERGADWGHYLTARPPRYDLLWSRHGAQRPCCYIGRVSLIRLRWVLTFILRLLRPSISRRHGWRDTAHLQIFSDCVNTECRKVNSEVAPSQDRPSLHKFNECMQTNAIALHRPIKGSSCNASNVSRIVTHLASIVPYTYVPVKKLN